LDVPAFSEHPAEPRIGLHGGCDVLEVRAYVQVRDDAETDQ